MKKNKKVKYVELIYENCEVQTIDVKDVCYLGLNGIKDNGEVL